MKFKLLGSLLLGMILSVATFAQAQAPTPEPKKEEPLTVYYLTRVAEGDAIGTVGAKAIVDEFSKLDNVKLVNSNPTVEDTNAPQLRVLFIPVDSKTDVVVVIALFHVKSDEVPRYVGMFSGLISAETAPKIGEEVITMLGRMWSAYLARTEDTQ